MDTQTIDTSVFRTPVVQNLKDKRTIRKLKVMNVIFDCEGLAVRARMDVVFDLGEKNELLTLGQRRCPARQDLGVLDEVLRMSLFVLWTIDGGPHSDQTRGLADPGFDFIRELHGEMVDRDMGREDAFGNHDAHLSLLSWHVPTPATVRVISEDDVCRMCRHRVLGIDGGGRGCELGCDSPAVNTECMVMTTHLRE